MSQRIFAIATAIALLGANPVFSSRHHFRIGETIVQTLTTSLSGRNEGTFHDRSTIRIHVVAASKSAVRLSARVAADGASWTESPLARIDLATQRIYNSAGADITPNVTSLYNPVVWGALPMHPTEGEHWLVSAARHGAFPSAKSTVRVMSIDPRTREIRLKLTGSGIGPTDTDVAHPGNLILTIRPIQGTAHYQVRQTIGQSSLLGNMILKHGLVYREDMTVKTAILAPRSPLTPAYTWVRTFRMIGTQRSDTP